MRVTTTGRRSLRADLTAVAIVLAIVRVPQSLGPLYVDEWVMIVAAFVTIMSAVEYLTRFSSKLSADVTREESA